MPLLELDQVGHAFGAVRALHDVTLRVEPGGGRPVQTSKVEAACSR